MSISPYSKNQKIHATNTSSSNASKKIKDDRSSNNFMPKGPPRKSYFEQRRLAYNSATNSRNWRSQRLGSQSSGGSRTVPKKVLHNHLLNFSFEPRQCEEASVATKPRFKPRYRKNSSGFAFNKERFLQANCQFAVAEKGEYDIHFLEPDTPVPWEKIEQVFLETEDELSCPICLYPPSVAKITRCGHVYCWPCILHYLVLDDNGHSVRDCPICGADVRKSDLKSTSVYEVIPLRVGTEIEMDLMFRDKGSLTPLPISEMGGNDLHGRRAKISKFSPLLVLNAVVEPELEQLRRKLTEQLDEFEKQFVNCAVTECQVRKTALLNEIAKEDEGKMPDLLKETDQEGQLGATSSKELKTRGGQDRYYFYQAKGRELVFLNGLNVKCLLREYGDFKQCPPTLAGELVQCESFVMTEDLRKRHKYLSHLPLSCEYKLVELCLKPPLVSQSVLDEFHEEISARARNRERKERRENESLRLAEIEQQRKMNGFLRGSSSTGSIPVLVTDDSSNHTHESAFCPALPVPGHGTSPPEMVGPTSKSFAEMLKTGEIAAAKQHPKRSPIENVANLPTSSGGARKIFADNDDDDDNEMVDPEYVAPAYQSSFGDALSMALNSLNLYTNANGGTVLAEKSEVPKAVGKQKKKKKKKQTLLFSTSAHMHT